MPRTKFRNGNQNNKRPKKKAMTSDINEEVIKEMERIYDDVEKESALKWQKRKSQISEIFNFYRSRLGAEGLKSTVMMNVNSMERSSVASSVNGSVCTGYNESNGSLKSKRIGPLAASLARSRRRSKSANGTTSTTSTSRITRADTTNHRSSRSKHCTLANNRLQTMSADRGIMNPVTPKFQMNTSISWLRYPKIGETVISMSGSPVIATTGALQGIANNNIPISNGIFSMQPTALSEIDFGLVSQIDDGTIVQLRQLKDNLAKVMETISKWK